MDVGVVDIGAAVVDAGVGVGVVEVLGVGVGVVAVDGSNGAFPDILVLG